MYGKEYIVKAQTFNGLFVHIIRRGLTKLDPIINRGDEVESQTFLCVDRINGKILSMDC